MVVASRPHRKQGELHAGQENVPGLRISGGV